MLLTSHQCRSPQVVLGFLALTAVVIGAGVGVWSLTCLERLMSRAFGDVLMGENRMGTFSGGITTGLKGFLRVTGGTGF